MALAPGHHVLGPILLLPARKRRGLAGPWQGDRGKAVSPRLAAPSPSLPTHSLRPVFIWAHPGTILSRKQELHVWFSMSSGECRVRPRGGLANRDQPFHAQDTFGREAGREGMSLTCMFLYAAA